MATKKKNTSRNAPSAALLIGVQEDVSSYTFDQALESKLLTVDVRQKLEKSYEYAGRLRASADDVGEYPARSQRKSVRDAIAGIAASQGVRDDRGVDAFIREAQKRGADAALAKADADNAGLALALHKNLEAIAAKLYPEQKAQFEKQFLDWYDLKAVTVSAPGGKSMLAYRSDPDPDGPKLYLPVPLALTRVKSTAR